MHYTIVIARERKSSKDVILADTSVPYPKQRAVYETFKTQTNDQYESVILAEVVPSKKPILFKTAAEIEQRKKLQEKADAEAKKAAEVAAAKKGKGAASEAAASERAQAEKLKADNDGFQKQKAEAEKLKAAAAEKK